jgi:HD-GYP domain-containing protein (c-di-GMP phosphodiesterase class II)
VVNKLFICLPELHLNQLNYAGIDTVVQFREIETKPQALKGTTVNKKAKLSFVKLGEDLPKINQVGAEAVPDQNRKLLYEEASAYIGEVLNALRNRKGFSLEKGFEVIRKIVAVTYPQDPVLILALHQDDLRRYVTQHPVNVAVFAIKMADHLGFQKSIQVEIGMAGLLHDVGMAVVPDNILYKQGRLDNAEMKIFRQRPNFSWKILRTLGCEYAYLAECAAQVYERIDGSGYP